LAAVETFCDFTRAAEGPPKVRRRFVSDAEVARVVPTELPVQLGPPLPICDLTSTPMLSVFVPSPVLTSSEPRFNEVAVSLSLCAASWSSSAASLHICSAYPLHTLFRSKGQNSLSACRRLRWPSSQASSLRPLFEPTLKRHTQQGRANEHFRRHRAMPRFGRLAVGAEGDAENPLHVQLRRLRH